MARTISGCTALVTISLRGLIRGSGVAAAPSAAQARTRLRGSGGATEGGRTLRWTAGRTTRP